jgi:hypothetical protein
VRGVVSSIGNCAGQLSSSGQLTVAIAPGEEIALHLVGGVTAPAFHPPEADPAVAEMVGLTDGGTTATYRGVAPGTTLLSITAWCDNPVGTTFGPCPLVQLIVSY